MIDVNQRVHILVLTDYRSWIVYPRAFDRSNELQSPTWNEGPARHLQLLEIVSSHAFVKLTMLAHGFTICSCQF
jgi:hypothetical protein